MFFSYTEKYLSIITYTKVNISIDIDNKTKVYNRRYKLLV